MNTNINSTNQNIQSNPNKKFFKGAGQFDKHRSTFRWLIYLETGKVLDGYSCGKYSEEPQDKIFLLESVMLRLYRSGYWKASKCLYIEWYLQDIYGEKSNDELITVTTPTEYKFGTCEKYVHNERLQKFMRRFYESIKSGKVSDQLRDRPVRITEKDKFSVSHKRFNTSVELVNYCAELKKFYPEGLVRDFYYKYIAKYSLDV